MIVECDGCRLRVAAEGSHVVRLLGKGCSMVGQQSLPLSILQDRLVRQRAASSVSLLSRLSYLTGSFLIGASSQSVAVTAAGFSGAELANVVNEAALLAGRAGKDAVDFGELVEGVQRTK